MLKKNKLESELANTLNNMDYEEILKYYNGLNRNFINSYPSIASINGDPEKFNSLYDVIQSVNKILFKRYNFIEAVDFINKFEILNNKYIEEVNEGNFYYYLRYYIDLKAIVESLAKDLGYLKQHLTRFYLLYKFRMEELEDTLTSLGVPEDSDILDSLESYIYNEDNSFFYGTSLEKHLNSFIEQIVNNIEDSIANLEPYTKSKIDVDVNKLKEVYPEKIVLLIKGLKELIALGLKYLEEFQSIKEEPFKEAIEVLVEVHLGLIKEANLSTSEEELRKNLEEHLPRYDFKEFKLITDLGRR